MNNLYSAHPVVLSVHWGLQAGLKAWSPWRKQVRRAWIPFSLLLRYSTLGPLSYLWWGRGSRSSPRRQSPSLYCQVPMELYWAQTKSSRVNPSWWLLGLNLLFYSCAVQSNSHQPTCPWALKVWLVQMETCCKWKIHTGIQKREYKKKDIKYPISSWLHIEMTIFWVYWIK